jgi:two-component system, chemotaxis family, sensor kinase CheA
MRPIPLGSWGREAFFFVGLAGAVAAFLDAPFGAARPLAANLIGLAAAGCVLAAWVLAHRTRRGLSASREARARIAQALEERNRTMQLVFDNVERGLVVVGNDGTMISDGSAVLERWFGSRPASRRLPDYVRPINPTFAEWLELGLAGISAGVMPMEILLLQLPQRLELGERVLSFGYKSVLSNTKVARLLVTITDITAELEHERAEAVQRDLVTMFELIRDDRSGVINFLQEGNMIVEEIACESTTPKVTARLVHTLKGNAAQFGLSAVTTACHEVEERLGGNALLLSADRRRIMTAWSTAAEQIGLLVGTERTVTIDTVQYRSLLALVRARGDEDVLAAIADWDRDPVQARLDSLGAFAERLACELGKHKLSTVCEGNDRRLDYAGWASFWTSCVHVIRNAVDHGIEDAITRTERGKPPGGRIVLRADVVDDRFVVTISDDGPGINWQKLERKALDEQLAFETPEERLEVLFCDGMSTKTHITNTSGRGVGLSAFRAEVLRRHGTLEVTTSQGEGTTFTARFPIPSATSLAIAA